MAKQLFYFLLFLSFAAVGIFADEEKNGAVEYTAEELKSGSVEVGEIFFEKPHFVKFYAPWCGHCKRLAPTWDELADKFRKDEEDVVIAKVDCTEQTKLCSDHGVTGYPTLKFFADADHAEGVKYRGARDMASLAKFVKAELNPEEEEDEEEEAEEEVKKEDSGPAKAVDGLFELTADNFAKTIEKGNFFIKFFAPWCGHCKRLVPTWEELAKDTENDETIGIAKIDCTAHGLVCRGHEVKGYPTLLFFKDGQKIDKFAGARDKSSLVNFINKMKEEKPKDSEEQTAEKVPEDLAKEEKPKEEVKGAVVVLGGDTFEQGISKGLTFVKFFAPWCGHCKRLAPTWVELAEKYSENANVNIADVDCTLHKETCTTNGVRGYPTLILFRDGAKVGDHNGGRTIDALSKFIQESIPRDEL